MRFAGTELENGLMRSNVRDIYYIYTDDAVIEVPTKLASKIALAIIKDMMEEKK